MKEKLIKIKNDLSELETIVSALDNIAEEWSFPPKLILNLNLVLEELITNTISYGYESGDDGIKDIGISLSLDGVILRITLIDDAQAFDPLQKDDPDSLDDSIEDREVGGLGIFMVKKLMDEIKYSRENNQNILVLEKNIAAENII